MLTAPKIDAAPVAQPRRIRNDAPARPERDFRSSLRLIAEEAGADRHLLVKIVDDSAAPAEPVAGNWTFDDVAAFGARAAALLHGSSFATFPGAAPQPAHPLMLSGLLGTQIVASMRRAGDEEIYCLKLFAGRSDHCALLSARQSGSITPFLAQRAQLRICHLLCEEENAAAPMDRPSPLTTREADCLRWVSQGKTTEEVAMILGVSPNTINGYITQSITKLSAGNRAMATAIALRQGFI